MKMTNEDIEQIKKFKELRDKGYYVVGQDVTNLYNKVFEKNIENSNCSSCIRRRIGELIIAMETFVKQTQLNKPSENNEEKISEENGDKQKPQKAKGRKKKSESA